MLRRTQCCIICFVSILMTSGISARAAIVLNSSFEEPVIPGNNAIVQFNSGDTIGSGWVIGTGPGGETRSVFLLSSGALGGPTTIDGNQYLLMAGAEFITPITQNLTLGGTSQYRLGFQLAGQPDGGGSVDIDILRGGASIVGGPQQFSVPQSSGFQNFELPFTTGVEDTYSLLITSAGESTSIDAFTLTAVPEPSLHAFLVVGAFVLSNRRRNRLLDLSMSAE